MTSDYRKEKTMSGSYPADCEGCPDDYEVYSSDSELKGAIGVNEVDDGWELDLTHLYLGPFGGGLEVMIRRSTNPCRSYYDEAATLDEALDHAIMSVYDNCIQTFRDHGLQPPADICLTVGPHPDGRPYHEDPTLEDWKHYE